MLLVVRLSGLRLVVARVQQFVLANVAVLDMLSQGCLHELIDLEICFLDPLSKHLLDLLVLRLQ